MSNEEFDQYKEESARTWQRIDNKCEFLVEQHSKVEQDIQQLVMQQAKTDEAIKNLMQIMVDFATNAEADRQIMRNMLAKMGIHDEKILDHEKRLRKLEE